MERRRTSPKQVCQRSTSEDVKPDMPVQRDGEYRQVLTAEVQHQEAGDRESGHSQSPVRVRRAAPRGSTYARTVEAAQ